MKPPLLTAHQVAERLGISTATVLRWTKKGELPGFRMPSKAVRYDEQTIEAWIEGRAIVLCMDEKSQIQALDRTQPSLPMKPGERGR